MLPCLGRKRKIKNTHCRKPTHSSELTYFLNLLHIIHIEQNSGATPDGFFSWKNNPCFASTMPKLLRALMSIFDRLTGTFYYPCRFRNTSRLSSSTAAASFLYCWPECWTNAHKGGGEGTISYLVGDQKEPPRKYSN